MSVRSESSSRPADAGLVLLTLAVGLGLLTASWGALHLPPFDRYQIIDTPVYQEYGEAMAAGEVPYRDFDLEYPPGALPTFWLPTLGPAEHYASIFEALMWLCAAALLALAVYGASSLGGSPVRLLAVAAGIGLFPLALGTVVLTRYDLWPAALTAAVLAAVLAGRERLALAVLGLAVAAKIYPLVLLPLLLVYVARRQGVSAAAIGFGWFAVALAVVVLPFAVIAPEGVVDSAQRQLERPLQIESLGASFLLAAHQLGLYDPSIVSTHGSQNLSGALPDALATAQTALQAAALVAVWILFARGRATPLRLVVACAASVVVFVAFGKVLSPQFMIWLVPVAALVAGRVGLAAGALLGAALVTTHLWFPTRYWDLVALEPVGWLALVRNVLLVTLAVVLGIATARARAAARSG
ncbi:MAG TPA: glycosyltransferase 87 family protein [Gaiellaceae bacterium]|nr:glycosyltransferase 87 family protein [Gaiellaceae bacterium]